MPWRGSGGHSRLGRVEAVRRAKPSKLACLSTIRAQGREPNLLAPLGVVEEALGGAPTPVTFLRAAWFMDDATGDVATASETEAFSSFLHPLGRMVATDDVGRVAADMLRDDWHGRQVVELEGPRPVAPADVAAVLTDLLGRPVRAETMARLNWEELFRRHGMRHPGPRLSMLDGFNEGWIRSKGQGPPRHDRSRDGAAQLGREALTPRPTRRTASWPASSSRVPRRGWA